MSVTVDDAVAGYITLRDKRSELKKEYEERDADLKTKMERIEVFLLQSLDKVGANSLNTDHGTAYISEDVRASCADWDALWSCIQQTGRFDLLEKRVASKAVREYREENGDLPPGVSIHSERVVRVRRS